MSAKVGWWALAVMLAYVVVFSGPTGLRAWLRAKLTNQVSSGTPGGTGDYSLIPNATPPAGTISQGSGAAGTQLIPGASSGNSGVQLIPTTPSGGGGGQLLPIAPASGGISV